LLPQVSPIAIVRLPCYATRLRAKSAILSHRPIFRGLAREALLNELLNELKRRNVFRVGVAYVVIAWLVAQVAELALDSFDAPSWVIKTILLLLALGLPAVLFFAWAFELTPEGLKKEKDVDRSQSITQQTGRKLNTTIMVMLVVAVGVLLFDKFALRSDAPPPAVQETAVNDNSVAVLPFVDMSPARDQEYFTDGLTENLLHALAQVRELKVAGRTSSFAFKGQNQDLREIGRQLNVSNILEGSVQKMGERVRITTQLIETEGGYHLWSETFDRDLTDIFSVQDEIATAVAGALRENLLGETTISAGYSGNFEAYNAYLLGLSYEKEKNFESWNKAEEQFRLALELDPNMALAWAALSGVYSSQTGFGSEFATGYERAREAALKAINLDPNLPEGYVALSRVQISHDWDWDGAEASLRRAQALRPGDSEILADLAFLERIRGDFEGALNDIEVAFERDPLNPRLRTSRTHALASVGRQEEALAEAELLARATPDRGGVNYMLGVYYSRAGRYEEALAAVQKEVFPFLRLELEAIVYHRLGNTEIAAQKLDELKSTFGDDVSWQVATVYAAMGDADNTFAALNRGFEIRDPGLVFIQGNPLLEPFHDDPRYDDLLKRMGLR
jgi:adenylate cyclase